MKIAFIGLGNMGGGMAANLVKNGHEVRAFDLSEDALAKAKSNGCETFTDAKEAVQGVDAVVSMLPNGGIVKSVYEGSVIGKAPAGAVLLDCSTIDVATAKEVTEMATAKGYKMVDAPVSGGIAAAENTAAGDGGHSAAGCRWRGAAAGADPGAWALGRTGDRGGLLRVLRPPRHGGIVGHVERAFRHPDGTGAGTAVAASGRGRRGGGP